MIFNQEYIREGENTGSNEFTTESIMEFNFNPSIKEIPSDLAKIKNFLLTSDSRGESRISIDRISIETSTPLVLILIPLLLPLRDRVQVKIILQDTEVHYHSAAQEDLENDIRRTRKFKELLEAARSLQAHGITVIFAKKIM